MSGAVALQDSANRHDWVLGVDVGGTFTDVIALNRTTGESKGQKVLTKRHALEAGVMEAIRKVGIPITSIDEIVHGHTAGINAVLSRQGALTALIATAGHRDLLDIGRMDREFGSRFYDPTWLRPHQERPIVQRRFRYGILERIDANGEEMLPLDEAQLRLAVQNAKRQGVESFAISFLNAYLSQRHEIQAAAIVREEYPEAYVQTSALYPVTKESERTATVALDAYVGPTITGYLKRLEAALVEGGFVGTLWIMTMNGGVGSVEETARFPVFQLVSGPVGGVSGARHVARTGSHTNLLSMDVGGTSTDIAAIRDAQTPLTDLWSVEHGLTMTMPVVDVESVGSGAGSIIHIDKLGTLRVGPESAGSDPGPACYGRGGKQATLTDACVELGILQSDLFAGGSIELDKELAHRALSDVAKHLGMSPIELAEGAYRLACSDIAGSIRSISTYRGLDLRHFALLSFGAAGPMVASRVARELGVAQVLVPPEPGEFSAYGLLTSDLRVTRARSPMVVLGSYEADRLERDIQELEEMITADLHRQGISSDVIQFERVYSAMYSGQTWDNRLPLEPGRIDDDRKHEMESQVHRFYLARYGFSAEELPIILTTLEVTGVARRGETDHVEKHRPEGDPIVRYCSVWFSGEQYNKVPIYNRNSVPVDEKIGGPAVVAESYATTLVDPGSVFHVMPSGYLSISLT